MTAFFLPTFSPDISPCRGCATCAHLGNEPAVVSCESQKTLNFCDMLIGVGQFLIASTLLSSVVTPLAEMT